MSDMNPEFEKVMEKLRELEVTPNKLAAISAILLSESEGKSEDGEDLAVVRLDRAFGWICAEIDRIDPATGVRMMLALKELRKTLDGQGYWLEDEEIEASQSPAAIMEAWGDPEKYNRDLKADEKEEEAKSE